MIAIGFFDSHVERCFFVPQHLAVMADGLAPTGDIHIATGGTVPFGLSALNPRLTLALAFIIVATNAAFAQIVESCPYDIAHNIREIIRNFPVSEGIARITLCLPDNAFWVALVVAGVFENHIVIACHIEHLGMRVVDFPIAIPGTERLSNRTRVVYFQYSFLHLSSGIDHADVLALNNLVADAP